MFMFILFQVPIVDSRSFTGENSFRVKFPAWTVPAAIPEVEKGKQHFIRSFGGVEKRSQGGAGEWAGEEYYCRAEGAIRFKDSLSKKLFGSKEKNIRLDCAFRRFFCCDNHKIVSRLEVGFTRAGRWNSSLKSRITDSSPTILGAADIDQIITDILDLPVCIPISKIPDDQKSKEKETYTLLKEIGSLFAKKYFNATTSFQGLATEKLEKWWVTPGTLMLLIELGIKEDVLSGSPSTVKRDRGFKYEIQLPEKLPKGMEKVDIGDIEGIQIYYLKRFKPSMDVWILLYPNGDLSTQKKLREIRLHLSRINAERECLKLIIKQILGGQIKAKNDTTKVECSTVKENPLQENLFESNKRLSKDKSYGIAQRSLLEVLQKWDGDLHEGEYPDFLLALKGIKPNFLKVLSESIFVKNLFQVPS